MEIDVVNPPASRRVLPPTVRRFHLVPDQGPNCLMSEDCNMIMDENDEIVTAPIVHENPEKSATATLRVAKKRPGPRDPSRAAADKLRAVEALSASLVRETFEVDRARIDENTPEWELFFKHGGNMRDFCNTEAGAFWQTVKESVPDVALTNLARTDLSQHQFFSLTADGSRVQGPRPYWSWHTFYDHIVAVQHVLGAMAKWETLPIDHKRNYRCKVFYVLSAFKHYYNQHCYLDFTDSRSSITYCEKVAVPARFESADQRVDIACKSYNEASFLKFHSGDIITFSMSQRDWEDLINLGEPTLKSIFYSVDRSPCQPSKFVIQELLEGMKKKKRGRPPANGPLPGTSDFAAVDYPPTLNMDPYLWWAKSRYNEARRISHLVCQPFGFDEGSEKSRYDSGNSKTLNTWPGWLTTRSKMNHVYTFKAIRVAVPDRSWIPKTDVTANGWTLGDFFINHLRYVWCWGDDENEPDEKLFKLVLGWFSHMILKPGENVDFSIVLRGDQGCGKSRLIDDIVAKILPKACCRKYIGNKFCEGKFTAPGMEKLLLMVFDEMESSSTHERSERNSSIMKALITDKIFRQEVKNQDEVWRDKFFRLINFSNVKIPLDITLGDSRRWLAARCKNFACNDKEYWDTMTTLCNSYGALESVYKVLTDPRSISPENFNVRHIPVTGELIQQQAERMNSVQRWIFDILKTGKNNVRRRHYRDAEDHLKYFKPRSQFPRLGVFTESEMLVFEAEGDEFVRRILYLFPDNELDLNDPDFVPLVRKSAFYNDYIMWCEKENLRGAAVLGESVWEVEVDSFLVPKKFTVEATNLFCTCEAGKVRCECAMEGRGEPEYKPTDYFILSNLSICRAKFLSRCQWPRSVFRDGCSERDFNLLLTVQYPWEYTVVNIKKFCEL